MANSKRVTYTFRAIPGISINQTKDGGVTFRLMSDNLGALRTHLEKAAAEVRNLNKQIDVVAHAQDTRFAVAQGFVVDTESNVIPAAEQEEEKPVKIKRIVRVGMTREQAERFAIEQRRAAGKMPPKLEDAPKVVVQSGVEPDDGSLGEPPPSLTAPLGPPDTTLGSHGLEDGPGAFNV